MRRWTLIGRPLRVGHTQVEWLGRLVTSTMTQHRAIMDSTVGWSQTLEESGLNFVGD